MNENKEYISQAQNNGSLHISEEVVASVAGMAIMDVEGVCGLGAGLGADLADILGKKNLGRGVKITTSEENEITIDCSIVLKLGQNIAETAANVQEAVKTAVESVTGFKVSAVNVTVTGVALPKENKR